MDEAREASSLSKSYFPSRGYFISVPRERVQALRDIHSCLDQESLDLNRGPYQRQRFHVKDRQDRHTFS